MIKRTEKQKGISIIFEEFQRANQIKNLAEQTISYYHWNLKPFFDYLSEINVQQVDEVTSDIMDDFILVQKRLYSNNITINTHIKATRVFMYYCMSKNYLPAFKIHLIKQEEKVMATYSDADIQKLIVKPDVKTCSFVQYRDWAMINYFIETGNRLRSVVNLKVSDIDFNERRIIVRMTKNKEQLITPLTKTLLNILPSYIEMWGLEEDSYLFPSFKGEQIKESTVKQSITNYNRKHGVSIISIHAFRHTFARNYIVTGGSSFKLQSLLGHKDMEQTRHYVHLFGEDLASDIDEHSIVERIKPTTTHMTKKTKRF